MQFLNCSSKTSALRCTQLQSLCLYQSRRHVWPASTRRLPKSHGPGAPSEAHSPLCWAALSTESFDNTTSKLSKVAIIAGPTAIGKTAVSLELARLIGGEVVNADSVQVLALTPSWWNGVRISTRFDVVVCACRSRNPLTRARG
eukprot:5706509-Pyramimonas_sp.AAC.1